MNNLIEEGFCYCGCGNRTNKIKKTKAKQGRFKGEYSRFVVGHSNRGLSAGFDLKILDKKCDDCNGDILGKREDTKRCEACKKIFDLIKGKRYDSKRRLSSYHSKNYREYIVKKKYGITQSDFDILLEKQNSACAICERSSVDFYSEHNKRLFIDHCHQSGKVRGLLCDKCNFLIGQSNNNVNILERAIVYLMNNNQEKEVA